MRAWLVAKPGAADALELGKVETPKPGSQEVRVALRAIGVNRADILQRMGHYPPPPGFDPRRPGLEYAGEIVAVGSGVLSRRVGEPVMGLIGGGAYAEQVVVHERETLSIPLHYDYAQAAALPEAFLTAYRAVYEVAGLRPGQWALIRGATSSVGQAALQLVQALGSRAIATSRGQQRLDELDKRFKALGLNRAGDLAVTDGDNGVAETVQAATGGAHVVVDFVGAPALADNLAALRDEGCQVQVGVIGGQKTEIDMGQVLMRRLAIKAMTMRSLALERRIVLARQFNDQLFPLFEAGKLRPVIDRTFSFEQAPDAHRAMEAGEHAGKLVLLRD